MTAQRTAHIKDATDFFAAIGNSTLPAVSFVKPDGLLDGHPASSKLDLFEGMVKKTIDALECEPGAIREHRANHHGGRRRRITTIPVTFSRSISLAMVRGFR